jgi:hypothetical protein
MRRVLGSSLLVSLLAHAALGGGGAVLLRRGHARHHYEVPVELIAPDHAATIPKAPAPKPEAPKPKLTAQAMPDPPAPAGTDEKPLGAAIDHVSASGSMTLTKAPPPKPKPKQSAAVAQHDEVAAKTPAVDEPPDPDPADAAKAAVDLVPYTPAGAKVRVVLRVDRLRSSAYLAQIERILEPMPDYQSIMLGTKLSFGQAFDALLIATPNPDDPQETFLAAKTTRDVRAELPGVKWEDVAGGVVGYRANDDRYAADDQDPRVFLLPYPGWILLTQPAYIAKLIAPPSTKGKEAKPAIPAWLTHLSDLTDQTGGDASHDGPVMVLGFSQAAKTFDIPLLPTLVAPPRGMIALSIDGAGFAATGWFVFDDEATAKKFAADAEKARQQALHSISTRFILHNVHAYGAIDRLRFQQVGNSVAFFSHISATDGGPMLDAAGAWSKEWFEARRIPRRTPKKQK